MGGPAGVRGSISLGPLEAKPAQLFPLRFRANLDSGVGSGRGPWNDVSKTCHSYCCGKFKMHHFTGTGRISPRNLNVPGLLHGAGGSTAPDV